MQLNGGYFDAQSNNGGSRPPNNRGIMLEKNAYSNQ